MYAVLDQAAQRYGEAPAMHQPIGKGKYHTYSWIDYKCAVQEIACGLRSLGIGKGDVVAIHAETRAEFYLADLGILANGSIAAALYTTYPVLDQIGNLRASDAKAVFVEDSKSMQALIDAAGQNPLPVQWILLTGQAENALTLEALRAAGRKLVADDPQVFERICAEVQPEDAAILYLTSGATGEPKMGLTTHAALVANVDMGPIALRLTPDDCTISFLPSAHIAQRVVIELLPIEMGVPVWFSESLAKLPAEMKTICPTFLLAPPRVWERIFASINAEVKKKNQAGQESIPWRGGNWLRGRPSKRGRPRPFQSGCRTCSNSPSAWCSQRSARAWEGAYASRRPARRLWAKSWADSTRPSACR
jgi:long-chain acyl-CoA synthetase